MSTPPETIPCPAGIQIQITEESPERFVVTVGQAAQEFARFAYATLERAADYAYNHAANLHAFSA